MPLRLSRRRRRGGWALARRGHPFAAIHPAVAVPVGAAAAWLAVPGRLAVALMLLVLIVALMLRRRRRLGGGGRGNYERDRADEIFHCLSPFDVE